MKKLFFTYEIKPSRHWRFIIDLRMELKNHVCLSLQIL